MQKFKLSTQLLYGASVKKRLREDHTYKILTTSTTKAGHEKDARQNSLVDGVEGSLILCNFWRIWKTKFESGGFLNISTKSWSQNEFSHTKDVSHFPFSLTCKTNEVYSDTT